MLIYVVNYLLLPVYKLVISNKKEFCFIVSLQLFLILALRTPTLGIDLPTYNEGFQYISNLSFIEMIRKLHFIKTADLIYPFSFESGYVVLNWLVSKMGIGFQGLLAVCAAINVISIGSFIYKYSEEPLLSFSIFISFNIYLYCFGIIRQSLALSIVLWAVPNIINKKYFKASLIIMVAFLMHRVAIIILPMILLARIRVKKIHFVYTYMVAVVLMFAAPLIYKMVISGIMHSMGINRFTVDFRINNFTILIMIIGLLICLFFDFEVFENQSLNLSCWSVVLLILFEPFAMCNEVFARSMELYTVFLIILVPGLIYKYKNKKTQTITQIGVFILMFGYMIYSYSGSAIVPYKTFL